MLEPRDPRSIVEAAEAAAAAGDHSAAEALLREAARLQEASLGPLHPDLANTLNNLGVVCEINDHPVDAEKCFRRACAIATEVLESDHPFVATSRKNLRDFCDARGKPADRQPLSDGKLFGRFAIGALGPIAMLMVILAAGLPRLNSTERAESSSIPAPRQAPISSEQALSVEPISTPARPTLLRAQLCADVNEWHCDPADRPVPAGPLFFYTQVKSTTATTIQHRWYHGNRLHQSVELRVQARPDGYRAYSRNAMNSESAGSWRVELRTEDGLLLHEERFHVR